MPGALIGGKITPPGTGLLLARDTGNISGHLFSKAPNLTVLLLGENNVGDAIANYTDNRLFHNKLASGSVL